MSMTLEAALAYGAAGISVVPVSFGGAKKPVGKWKDLQTNILSPEEIQRRFRGRVGVATITGKVSGNAEAIDIDRPELVQPFEAAVRTVAPGLLEKLTAVASPRNNYGGRHLRFRVEGRPVSGNTKLAESAPEPQFNKNGTPKIDERTGKQAVAPTTWIETRGEGGYILAPGCPGECHETGLPYKHISGPPLTQMPTITAEEQDILWRVARSFNKNVEEQVAFDQLPDIQREEFQASGLKPGDDFNSRATWEAILIGWTNVFSTEGITHWRRPGKDIGTSATTGVMSKAGSELFCCFSSNAHPFQGPSGGRPCTSYTKFGAYAVLNYGGDFSAATKALAAAGYGEQRQQQSGVNISGIVDKHAAKPPAPTPLPTKRIYIPEQFVPFPLGSLPEVAGDFVTEHAKAIGCDVTLVGVPMLAALAGCIGNVRRLRIKHSWCAPAVVWAGVVVDSGAQKSPSQNSVMRYLYSRQGKDIEEHAEKLIEYQKAVLQWELDHKEWKSKKLHTEPPEKPQEPVCKRILISDATIEATADRLQDNPRGVLLDRDELSGWLGSFDQYRAGKGSDVSHWLSCYNARPLLIDRKVAARKTIFVQRAAVSITGGIQPKILGRMLGDKHFENGLASRFLFAMPPKMVKRWTNAFVGEEIESRMERVFDYLLSLGFTVDSAGKPIPLDLPLSFTGRAAFIEFFNQHGEEQADLVGNEAALWAKLEETAARLALIHHMVRVASQDDTIETPDAVDAVSMNAGVALARWFGNEGRRIYGALSETDDERDRRLLIDWIKRRGARTTSRDLQRGPRKYRSSPELAEQDLCELAKAGCGTWENSESNVAGHPTRVFILTLPGDTTPINHCENRDSVAVASDIDVESEGVDEEVGEWTY